MFARKVHHLRHFCFGHLVGEDATFTDPVMMHMQHDSRRGLTVLVEEALQHMHDEFHRRVVVIEDQHAIEVRLLGLRLGARDDRAARRSVAAASPAVFVGPARPQVTRSGRLFLQPSWPTVHGLQRALSDSDGAVWITK